MNLEAQIIINKPKPGDIYAIKKSIDVIDTKGNVLVIPTDAIITLIEIRDQSASMRLDRKTKFISNWICKFIYDKRMFILRSQNTCQSAMLFEYMELVTDSVADRLQSKIENRLQ